MSAALFLWFIAVAFPFYGLINSIIGALTGSMVSFILPAFAYNWYYLQSSERRANAPKQPPRCANSNFKLTGVQGYNLAQHLQILSW